MELTVYGMTSQKSICVANYSAINLHIEIIQARDSHYIASLVYISLYNMHGYTSLGFPCLNRFKPNDHIS